MLRKSLLLLSAPAVLVLAAICAHPAVAQFRAAFTFTERSSCIVTEQGFNGSFQANNAPIWVETSTSLEYVIFRKNGTGKVTGNGVDIINPVAPGTLRGSFPTASDSSASSWSIQYGFTYNVDNSGVITMELDPNNNVQTFATGPRTNQTASQDGLELFGFLSSNGTILSAATGATNVENKTYSNGDRRQQVCTRSATGVK